MLLIVQTCFRASAKALILITILFSDTSAQAIIRGDSLSIEQFLDLVNQSNPISRAAMLEQNVANATLRNARGGFDPTLNFDFEHKTKSGKDVIDGISGGIELPLNVIFSPKIYTKYKRNLGSKVNPEDLTDENGEVSLGLKFPLLQGIFTDKKRASLAKAELAPQFAKATQTEIQNELLLESSELYWDWTEAYSQLAIAKRVYVIAKLRTEATAERVVRGEVAAIDSIEALQEVEKRRGEVFKAERKVESTSIKLAVLLWNQDGTPKSLNAIPTGIPSLPFISTTQIEADKIQAIQARPEALGIRAEQQYAQIEIDFRNELQRPNLDLNFEALQYKFKSFGVEDYKFGLTISQPLFFREANAQVDFAEIKFQKTTFKRLQIERKILAQIDDAISAVTRALERVDAAERETKYARLVESGERKRFQSGESSLLILNLRERATAQAEQGLIAAQADYLRAVSNYLWATGKIQQKWIR